MKRLITLILLGSVTIFTLAGCGVSEENKETNGQVIETNQNVKMVNPFVKYENLEEAMKDMGFKFDVPKSLPNGYSEDEISVITNGNSKLAQVRYKKGESDITYRVAKTLDDISGDYNKYESTEVSTMGNRNVTLRKNGKLVYIATWNVDGITYCLSSNSGLSTGEIKNIITSI